ncbi:MFS transporter [Streptomyces tubbatahanensis]|uniref:MFS transporter n=1 Tax=Streptomyces tubbatahanensis TaxID=2923272 RepID=A0ABY3XZ91_9ACTN|nr:MFS transporter [Streptomyces tubbatahanensis]UNS99583.1 MFS transporter [Streptomyces tubbatahanensis]
MSALRWAAALGNADWHLCAPLLVALAAAWHTDIATVTTGIAAYSLGQGLALPLWGWLADRYGPGHSLRTGLAVAAAASVGSALCPGPGWWVALRTAAGAGFATVTPSVSLYYESLRSAPARQRAFATLTTVTAASAIASPVLADTVLRIGSWRPAFAVIAVLTAVTIWRLGDTRSGQAEAQAQAPAHGGRRRTGGFAASPTGDGARERARAADGRAAGPRTPDACTPRAGSAARTCAAYGTVLGLGAAEGAVLLGLPALLAPALATAGEETSTSAVLVTYALGVLTGTLVLRRHARVWSPKRLLGTGGSLAMTGAFLAAVLPGTGVLMLCAALLGVAWSYLHTTLQTWLPRLLPPPARARAASLFSAAAILASSATVAATTSLLQDGRHSAVFATGAALCAALTCWTLLVARRWPGPGPQPGSPPSGMGAPEGMPEAT